MKKRKEKVKIPYGIYCYGLNKDGKTVLCPHWYCSEDTCGCKYLQALDAEKETLLWDHCKECGVHETVPPRIIGRYVKREKLSTADYRKFREQEG